MLEKSTYGTNATRMKIWVAFWIIRAANAATIKGQLQRFHNLISNDRLWPSEYSFEVIFEKSLFVFEITALKVRN